MSKGLDQYLGEELTRQEELYSNKKAVKKIAYKTTKEKLAEVLDTMTYMPNAASSWIEAFGDKRIADVAKKHFMEAKEILERILMQMPESVIYHVYGLPDGNLKFNKKDELVAHLKKHGISQIGTERGTQLRKTLQGQPKFESLLGPMYDGGNKVRYETREVYKGLST